MGASTVDPDVLKRHDDIEPKTANEHIGDIMKLIRNMAPWLATAAIVTAIGFAPVAAAAAIAPLDAGRRQRFAVFGKRRLVDRLAAHRVYDVQGRLRELCRAIGADGAGTAAASSDQGSPCVKSNPKKEAGRHIRTVLAQRT